MHHHNHGHQHHHRRSEPDLGGKHKKVLFWSLSLTAVYAFVELFAGFFSKSLALVSDASHMMSDAFSMALSLVAVFLAAKGPSGKKTFGYRRAETLAALFNGISLLVVPVLVSIEAVGRFLHPAGVMGAGMLKVAVFGLAVNLLVAYILSKGDAESNLNVKSALAHVFSDILGSAGAIAASLLILGFGWNWTDPAASLLISAVIFKGGWGICKEALNVLMEGVPNGVCESEVRSALEAIPGVVAVSSLGLWSIASGDNRAAVHLQIEEGAKESDALAEAKRLLQSFGLEETVQIEKNPQ